MDRFTASWQFWAIGSAIFAAATAILAKVGTQGIAPDLATLVRTAVVLVALLGLVTVTAQWRTPEPVPGSTWVALVLSGVATAASWVCWFRAVKLGEVARVAPIDKLAVVLIAVFGVVFLGERLSGVHWLGIGLIATGALLLAVES